MEWVQKADERVLLWIQEYLRDEAFDGFWRVVTFLGDKGWFWILLGAVLLFVGQTRLAGLGALLSMGLGAIVTNLILKKIISRPRPYDGMEEIIPLVQRLSDWSFPSGHTCAAFASAYIYWKLLPGKYGGIILIFAVLMGFSRLYLGMHYPTDVLGGFFVGWFSGMVIYKILEKIAEHM